MLSLMPSTRHRLSTYHITISTLLQHRHFQKESNAELFLQVLLRYRDANKFQLHAFAIMPDHVHLLLTPALDQPTSRIVQLLKGGYSHASKSYSAGRIWHSGHHEHRIRNASDFANQYQYIANNPLAAGLSLDDSFVHINPRFKDGMDPLPSTLSTSALPHPSSHPSIL